VVVTPDPKVQGRHRGVSGFGPEGHPPDRHPKATAHTRSLESRLRRARRPRVQVDSKRPARHTTGPLKVTCGFELLSRGSSAPSTHQDGCVHSLTGEPARAAALPAAVFRPRRFYGLDGLLRNPPLSGFPRTTLLGFGSPSRDPRLARAAPFPARPSPLELDDRPGLRNRFRLRRPIGSSGVCSSRRPSSLAFGFPPARTRLPPGLLFVGPRPLRWSRSPKGA
jgi:hypothetical protein